MHPREAISDCNNCTEEGDVLVVLMDWKVTEGIKLKSLEAGPSSECAENSTAWLELLVQKRE